jgi:hypothetical protein
MRLRYRLLNGSALVAMWLYSAAASASPIFTTFEAAGASSSAITATRDAFRTAIGGGTLAGADGSFGGERREINWDGVPSLFSDPNQLPGDFFNDESPRGVEFATPGTGFLVSADAGSFVPVLFGFANELQTFSPQKLFTAVNSNTVDVRFFLPGTDIAATTTAFGLIFVDVEVADVTSLQFFDADQNLIYERDALVSGNQGLSFLGVTVTGGSIGRVRITSGLNTIVSNSVLGNPSDDFVAMDDFIYAEPQRVGTVAEPSSLLLIGIGVLASCWLCTGRRRSPVLARHRYRSPAGTACRDRGNAR